MPWSDRGLTAYPSALRHAAQPAPRVSSNIPHVKRQIAFARQMKEMSKGGGVQKGVGQRNTYNKKKAGVQRDALALDVEYWEEEQLPQTVLLVDGYNVIK